jgi:F-type H+-transporting ATPase subunit delta
MSTTETRTFARALYETLLGNALEQLRGAAAKIDGNADRASIQQSIDAALPASALTEVRNFLAVLAGEQALDQLPAIIGEFESLAGGAAQRALSGEVTSAVGLGPEQQRRIAADLRQRYGHEVELVFNVDPSLIGGLIIRVGDQVLDNSLRTRLSQVQRNMLAS